MWVQVGDKLRRSGPLGSVHAGVYVVHNNKDGGVELVYFATFRAGQVVNVTPLSAQSGYEREQMASRALPLLGQKYDLANFNCEHLVSYAQMGIPTSPQLRFVAGLAIVFAFLTIIAPRARILPSLLLTLIPRCCRESKSLG